MANSAQQLEAAMISMIPIKMLFSLIIWVTVIYTATGGLQLILFESMAKKEDPKARTYSKMSPKNQAAIRKALFKILRGSIALILLAFIKNTYS